MSQDRDRPEPDWSRIDAEVGCCETCLHARINVTRRGPAYLRCLRAGWDDRLPRYPTLPVLACPGFERAEQGR